MAKRAREIRLDQLKQEDDKMPPRKNIKMTPMGPSIAFNSKTSVKSTLPLPIKKSTKKLGPIMNWEDVNDNAEYITWKRKDKQNPRLVQKGKRKGVTFLLAPLLIKEAFLGHTGTLDLVGELSKARFSIDLKPGIPDKLKAWSKKNKIPKQQEECLDFLNDLIEDGLKHAWVEDCWDKGSEKDDGGTEEEFIGEAYKAWLKEYTDSNGDDDHHLNLKRYLNTYDGKPNKPTLWKKNEEGEYEVYETDTLPEGSLVQVQASVRFYNIEGEMYGSSMDIGDNIIVIYVPPPATHTDNIPYIEF